MEQMLKQEIAAACRAHTDWLQAVTPGATIHIAVMAEPFLTCVFAGQKTVESRFSINKVAPFNKVRAGDLILMKAGPIVGCFKADWVQYFDVSVTPIAVIKAKYGTAICGDDNFWQSKQDKRYVTLIGIKNVQRLAPTAITKRDRRGWVTIL